MLDQPGPRERAAARSFALAPDQQDEMLRAVGKIHPDLIGRRHHRFDIDLVGLRHSGGR